MARASASAPAGPEPHGSSTATSRLRKSGDKSPHSKTLARPPGGPSGAPAFWTAPVLWPFFFLHGNQNRWLKTPALQPGVARVNPDPPARNRPHLALACSLLAALLTPAPIAFGAPAAPKPAPTPKPAAPATTTAATAP